MDVVTVICQARGYIERGGVEQKKTNFDASTMAQERWTLGDFSNARKETTLAGP
jgi:hypothetical protein